MQRGWLVGWLSQLWLRQLAPRAQLPDLWRCDGPFLEGHGLLCPDSDRCLVCGLTLSALGRLA